MRFVTVSKKDIEEGTRSHAHFCPIAIAIKRTFGLECGDTAALGDRIRVVNKFYSCSQGLVDFVENFDAGDKVKPFRLKLDDEKFKATKA